MFKALLTLLAITFGSCFLIFHIGYVNHFSHTEKIISINILFWRIFLVFFIFSFFYSIYYLLAIAFKRAAANFSGSISRLIYTTPKYRSGLKFFMMSTLRYQNTNVFQDDLLPGEEILWSGQPDPDVNFNRSDIFLIPFTIFWVFFIGMSFFSVWIHHPMTMNLNFLLSNLPFLLIGFYLLIGRFIFKKIKKSKTYYAVTNKRILVLSQLFGRNLQSDFINTLATINKVIRNSGVGTLVFGNNSTAMSRYGNSGMDFFSSFNGTPPAFYDIKDANKIYQLILDLRNNQKN